VLAAHIRRLRTRLLLPQDRDDPLFREQAALRVRPLPGDGLYQIPEVFSGLRSLGLSISGGVGEAIVTVVQAFAKADLRPILKTYAEYYNSTRTHLIFGQRRSGTAANPS